MKAVLTGDIISSSRQLNKKLLLKKLKKALNSVPQFRSEIFSGDSFQMLVKAPEESLKTAMLIKSRLLMEDIQNSKLDVRIAVGIGTIDYKAKTLAESTGEAFIRSGRLLQTLKEKNSKLGISSGAIDRDKEINAALKLITSITDEWTTKEAEVSYYLLKENYKQSELANKLKISQPAVNKRASRAHIYEIIEAVNIYSQKLNNINNE